MAGHGRAAPISPGTESALSEHNSEPPYGGQGHDDSDGNENEKKSSSTSTDLEGGLADDATPRGDNKKVDPAAAQTSAEQSRGGTAQVDPNLVTWDGPDDPQNPRNWPRRKKWVQLVTVSFFTLLSPVASSMLAPALPAIAEELHMSPGTVTNMSLSIFILAYAVGPLILAPLSEIWGRQIILQGANMFFLIFNIACALAHTPTQMIVFRFLAGLGGSAPLAVGGGTISDLFTPEERGLAMSIYTLAPTAGPALGPIAGGFIAENTSWRWVFYTSSIADGIVQIFGFILLRETYPPKILGQKAKRLRLETGNDKLQTQWYRPDRTLLSVIGHGLLRPMRFLATEPIVQVFAAYMSVLYGVMYLTLATFASLWTKDYGENVGISGLHYIALGLGYTLGIQFGSRVLDGTYASLKARNGGVGTPEMRLPLMIITSFLTPIGLIIYGWTAHKHVFWLVPDIGMAIYAIGSIGSTLAIQTYVIDNFALHAASGLAAATAWRSVAGFGFPLFADAMFSKLGIGWGNSVLALTLIVFLPAPWFFYRYGPYLRSKSPNAIKQAAKNR